MKASIKEVVEKLPDFEDFLELTDYVRDLSFSKMSLDVEIKSKEAEIFRTAVSDEKYFVNGKPPSATYINSAYSHTGFEGELLPLRNELAQVSSDLEAGKAKMEVYRNMLDVFRTLSANERGVTF